MAPIFWFAKVKSSNAFQHLQIFGIKPEYWLITESMFPSAQSISLVYVRAQT